jgi:hypothetical protein
MWKAGLAFLIGKICSCKLRWNNYAIIKGIDKR